MTEPIQFALLGIAGIALLAFCYWLEAIGVRGGSVSREESPFVYWFGMGVLTLATLMCFGVAIWTSV